MNVWILTLLVGIAVGGGMIAAILWSAWKHKVK